MNKLNLIIVFSFFFSAECLGFGIFDCPGPGCPSIGGDLGNAVEKAVQDTGKTIEKAAQDTGKTAEKAVQDTGKTLEKAAHDTGATSNNSSESFLCTYGELTRTIVVDSPSNHPDYACRLFYESGKGISMPWYAKHQESYCLQKALEFVALQETWGWSCKNN